MLGGDQAREHGDAAAPDDVVVLALAELDAAQLRHGERAAEHAVLERRHRHRDEAVHDAVHLHVGAHRAAVVEQQHGAAALGEALLEGEDLAPVAQRVLREQAHLGERVEHHALRPQTVHLLEQQLAEVGELHLGGLEERVLRLAGERALDGGELDDGDAREVPAVRARHGVELGLGLGERDVEAALALAHALLQELQREGGLAYAGIAVDEVEAGARQAAAEDVVEPGDAGAAAGVCFAQREKPRSESPYLSHSPRHGAIAPARRLA